MGHNFRQSLIIKYMKATASEAEWCLAMMQGKFIDFRWGLAVSHR
jgi:hypothetical protein